MRRIRAFLSCALFLLAASCSNNGGGPNLTLVSIEPTNGATTGGTVVTLTGTLFGVDATATIAGVPCVRVSMPSSTTITCTTGPHAPSTGNATGDVTVSSGGKNVTLAAAFTYAAPEITSWMFLDGNGATGLNKNVSCNAFGTLAYLFNSKIYAAWTEDNGTAYQIRVAVYNGNDAASGWTFVDGGGTNGVNRDPTQSARTGIYGFGSVNGKLYLAWSEFNGSVTALRVAVYNGNDGAPAWTFVDGGGTNGINRVATAGAFGEVLATLNNKLYAAWHELDSAYELRAAVYNGNDSMPGWTFVDGNSATTGLNFAAAQHAAFPTAVVANGKLYLGWYEQGLPFHVRARVYNGDDAAPAWTFVDGNTPNGLNKDPTKDATAIAFGVVGSKIYAAWIESNGTASQVRTILYNGNDAAPGWTFTDGGGSTGINKDPTQPAANPKLSTFNGKLYATWQELCAANEIRVAVYDGNDATPSWMLVDGNGASGVNWNTSSNAERHTLIPSGGRLYCIWDEPNANVSQVRFAGGQ